jgi:hypothetical protein
MLERIEHGPVEWLEEEPAELDEEEYGKPSNEELTARAQRRNEEDRLKELYLARHAPDPLPRSMREK